MGNGKEKEKERKKKKKTTCSFTSFIFLIPLELISLKFFVDFLLFFN